MKNSHKPQKRHLTAFERETERRRRQMLRDLSGTSHTSSINHRRLAVLIREGIKAVIVQDSKGKDVPLYPGPRPNLWRAMARNEKRRRMAIEVGKAEHIQVQGASA